MLAAFLTFYRKCVFVHKICGISWYHLKTDDFSIHKEYSDPDIGSKEFTMLAIQVFCQNNEENIFVVKAEGGSEIILSNRSSNLYLSGDPNKSCVGYDFRDLCENSSELDKFQSELKEFGYAKKSLDIISPDGQSLGRKNLYGEIVPGTNVYFCTFDPLSEITVTLDGSFSCSLPVSNCG